jgi:hypothetical protein
VADVAHEDFVHDGEVGEAGIALRRAVRDGDK